MAEERVVDAELNGSRIPSLVVRPQGLLLTFCAHFLLDQPGPLFTGSFVEVLMRAGVGEHAARTTLTRMAARGLLDRHRTGGKVYLSLTARAEQVLRDAEARVWLQGAVDRSWNGEWTALSFSMPESRRAERHQLRKRLGWEGFGLLHSGLWITPSTVDVARVLSGLGIEEEVKVFRCTPLPPTDVHRLVQDAWDLDALSADYTQFLTRWSGTPPRPDIEDALARFLLRKEPSQVGGPVGTSPGHFRTMSRPTSRSAAGVSRTRSLRSTSAAFSQVFRIQEKPAHIDQPVRPCPRCASPAGRSPGPWRSRGPG